MYAPAVLLLQLCRSGFSCCVEEDGYDSYGSMPGGHVRTWGTDNTIGSCDWTAVYVDGGVAITNNLDRLGTASAVCVSAHTHYQRQCVLCVCNAHGACLTTCLPVSVQHFHRVCELFQCRLV